MFSFSMKHILIALLEVTGVLTMQIAWECIPAQIIQTNVLLLKETYAGLYMRSTMNQRNSSLRDWIIILMKWITVTGSGLPLFN
jgi:hypothetical protein